MITSSPIDDGGSTRYSASLTTTVIRISPAGSYSMLYRRLVGRNRLAQSSVPL